MSRGEAQGLRGRESWSQLEAEGLGSCWGRRTHNFPEVAGRLTSLISAPELGGRVPHGVLVCVCSVSMQMWEISNLVADSVIK